MPTLKHLTCNVEWTGSSIALQEFQTTYADGYVETYIAVPPIPTPFSVHLQSNSYIAPGLAMFVYMDGVYQCNRNRHNLKIPDGKTPKRQTQIDFRVRQKEELMWDGSFEGKQWRFGKVNIAQDSEVEGQALAAYDGEYVGTIEVVVLRCYPRDTAKPSTSDNKLSLASPSDDSSAEEEIYSRGFVDGATDIKIRSRPAVLGLDGNWDGWGASEPPKKDQPKVNVEMKSAKTGVVHPVSRQGPESKDVEKGKRWDSRNESRDHSKPNWDRSQRGRSRRPRSVKDEQSPPRINTRGGRPGSYSVSTAPGSPGVFINIQNGTPPKAPAYDPWMGEPGPVYDFSKPPTVEVDSKGKVNAWDSWGCDSADNTKYAADKRSTGSYSPEQKSMPGGWGAAEETDALNGDSWNNSGPAAWDAPGKDDQKNDDWNNDAGESSWDAPKDETPEHDGWDNAAGDLSWDAPKDEAPNNDSGWDPPNDYSETNAQSWKNKDDDNNAQQVSGWDTTGNEDQQHGTWNAGDDTNQQGDSWGAESTDKAENTAGKNWPKAEKSAATETAPVFDFGNPKGKRSRAGSKGKPDSVKSGKESTKAKPVSLPFLKQSSDRIGKQSGNLVTGTTKGIPGAWSPPLEMSKPKNNKSKSANPVISLYKPGPGSSKSVAPKPKPYWSAWKGPNNRINDEMEEDAAPLLQEPEEPVNGVPVEVANRNDMSHQICPSRRAVYSHKTATPQYLDSHEDPYAVFVFKYRSKSIIENMLSTIIVESEDQEKARLASLSKDEILEQLMKTKAKLSTKTSSSDSSDKATFKSNPGGVLLEPDLGALSDRLTKLEKSGPGSPAVNGWLNSDKPNQPSSGGKWVGSNKGKKKGKGKGKENTSGSDEGSGGWKGTGGGSEVKEAWNWDNDENKVVAENDNNDNDETNPNGNGNDDWGNNVDNLGDAWGNDEQKDDKQGDNNWGSNEAEKSGNDDGDNGGGYSWGADAGGGDW